MVTPTRAPARTTLFARKLPPPPPSRLSSGHLFPPQAAFSKLSNSPDEGQREAHPTEKLKTLSQGLQNPSRPAWEEEQSVPRELREPHPSYQSCAPWESGWGGGAQVGGRGRTVTRRVSSCVATPPPAGAQRSRVPKRRKPAGP